MLSLGLANARLTHGETLWFEVVVIPQRPVDRVMSADVVADLYNDEPAPGRDESERPHYWLRFGQTPVLEWISVGDEAVRHRPQMHSLGGGGTNSGGWRDRKMVTGLRGIDSVRFSCEWLQFGMRHARYDLTIAAFLSRAGGA